MTRSQEDQSKQNKWLKMVEEFADVIVHLGLQSLTNEDREVNEQFLQRIVTTYFHKKEVEKLMKETEARTENSQNKGEDT